MGLKISLFKGFLARLLFAIHGSICVYRVWRAYEDDIYWLIAVPLACLFLENIITSCCNKGEFKWISLAVFLYLGCIIPSIWFLELDLYDERVEERQAKIRRSFGFNGSQEVVVKEADGNVLAGIVEPGGALGDIKLEISASKEDWVKVLEQTMFVILIFGRWMLPKGSISRDQLSQLLLVNIGMSADILELFEAFKEEQVMYNFELVVATMTLWSVAMSQFCLVVTATKARKTRAAGAMQRRKSLARIQTTVSGCCETEVWAICASIMMQDGPFLVMRILLIAYYKVFSYGNIFFTSKNTIVILLQLYRLYVMYVESKDNKVHPGKGGTNNVVVPVQGGGTAVMVNQAGNIGEEKAMEHNESVTNNSEVKPAKEVTKTHRQSIVKFAENEKPATPSKRPNPRKDSSLKSKPSKSQLTEDMLKEVNEQD